MANKGKGALRARDWACALRRCVCVCVCCRAVLVLVLVFVCFWCWLNAGLMSSVKGHSLDWPWTGPLSRLCARGRTGGHVLARILSPNSDPRDSRTSSAQSGLGTGRHLAALATRMGQTPELGSRQLTTWQGPSRRL